MCNQHTLISNYHGCTSFGFYERTRLLARKKNVLEVFFSFSTERPRHIFVQTKYFTT